MRNIDENTVSVKFDQKPTDRILVMLHDVKRSGDGYVALCPSHDDYHPSLSIGEGDDGQALLHCHAGCDTSDIVMALGLEMRDLFTLQPTRLPSKGNTYEAIYSYQDAEGRLLYQVLRTCDKSFRCCQPNDAGGWTWNMKGVERVLYRLPQLLSANPDAPVFLPEGEKDVDRLVDLGLVATTNPHGAGKWRGHYSKWLQGRAVVILPDNDDQGRDHALMVAFSLNGVAARVMVLELPDLPEKGDVSDWMNAGGTADDLLTLANEMSEWIPSTTLDFINKPMTDTGNGEVIAAMFGERLRYDHLRKRWLVWDAHRWVHDADGKVRRLAIEASRARFAAANIADDDKRKAIVKWAFSSEDRYRLNAAIDMASVLYPISDAGESWDSNPWLLGCDNGVVDLRTGVLHPGRPDDLITMTTGVAYDRDAICPLWKQFLSEVFDDDQELVDFIQRAIGYSISGDTREQLLFLACGNGANGKSTLLEVMRAALGDYAANTPFSTFELNRSIQTNDLAALASRRLVTAVETAEARQLNEARVKAVTGGDPVTARFLFREFFTYTPTYKVWLAMNHKPIITGSDEGIWRRVRPIPFNVSFLGREDKTLHAMLKEELPGILTWAVEGCLDWQEKGLLEPEAIMAAKEAYRTESDIVGQFLTDSTCADEGAKVKASKLYQAYRTWCEENGEQALTHQAFGRRLSPRGIDKYRARDGVYYRDIGLLELRNR